MSAKGTTSEAFFEKIYRADEDPWSFATSEYEQRRYAAIVDAVRGRRYKHAFEPGCSIGLLTVQLASLCDLVDATDISPTAVERARLRTQHLANVRTTCGALPDLIPRGKFDLIVFSEIGYYFTEDQLVFIANQLINRMRKSGVFLAAHWLGESPDHLLSGDRVHEILAQIPALSLQKTCRYSGFRLDLWTKQ